MKKAFTMIELIFVIVIIGILAAVAIPKLAETSNEARKSLILSFMGTLNRTIAPILWTNHLSDNGSVKTVTTPELLTVYTQVPTGVDSIDFSQCADANLTLGTKVADITTSALPNAEELFCIDGNPSGPPRFAFSEDMNKTLQNN